jgi:hypothetical protein
VNAKGTFRVVAAIAVLTVKAAVAKKADARTKERNVIFIEVDLLTANDHSPPVGRKSSSSYPEFVKFREGALDGMLTGPIACYAKRDSPAPVRRMVIVVLLQAPKAHPYESEDPPQDEGRGWLGIPSIACDVYYSTVTGITFNSTDATSATSSNTALLTARLCLLFNA